MNWLRDLKQNDEVVMVIFEEDGTEKQGVVRVDHVNTDEDDNFFRVYAGGRSFKHTGLCHGPDNTYSVIREKEK